MSNTTADKLQLLQQTKEAIKTAINNKGGTLTESDPFSSYASAIANLSGESDSLIDGSITSVNSNVTTLRNSAFAFCNYLDDVILPLVQVITNSAFRYCSNLANIQIQSATTIESNAFESCVGLYSIDLPNVTSIETNAFLDCYNLASITLGSSQVVTLDDAYSLPADSGHHLTIYVPSSLVEDYKIASIWSDYYNNGYVDFVAIQE